MVNLLCQFVGGASAIPVEVKEDETGADLIVQSLKPRNMRGNVSGSCAGRWSSSPPFLQMNPSLWIKNKNHFGANFRPGEGQIHVLVVPSDAEVTQGAKLSTLAMLLKQCDVSGDLPQQGDFLELFDGVDGGCGKVIDIERIHDIVHFTGSKFYVRKETLCVLESFMSVYRDELDKDEEVDKQFILMGSLGTGKSCILTLICFYVAVHYKRPVVWYRKASGGRKPSATRMFYEDKYYEWMDIHGKKFESLYDAMAASGNPRKCWFCLDGMVESEVKRRDWQNRYTLLATSGQFSPSREAMKFTKRCLVPYWKKGDLEDFGVNHLEMQESEVDARYFVSGGSLRYFLEDNGKEIIEEAVPEIAKPQDAEMLLTMFGVASVNQIDRIRMHGVEDVENAQHYVDTSKWRCCVTSRFALQCLAGMLKPNFFEKLMGIAKEMNDDRLEDVAFGGYFHSLVRHQRPIQVQYFEHNNVDRRMVRDWENIMDREIGSIEVNEQLVKCEGENKRECVEVLERWVADPASMDYWIPATSLCETIDAVAR